MKRTALFFAAAVLASPAFAAEDLCVVKMQQLEDSTNAITTSGSPLKEQVEEHKMMAEKARTMGNSEDCATHATQALQLLQKSDSQTTE